jgi:hypothetical protein
MSDVRLVISHLKIEARAFLDCFHTKMYYFYRIPDIVRFEP